jgi:hypothetical protein
MTLKTENVQKKKEKKIKLIEKNWVIDPPRRVGSLNRMCGLQESPKAVPVPVRGDANHLSFLRTQPRISHMVFIKCLLFL